MKRREISSAAAVLLAFAAVSAVLALSRTYLNYGTETDYVGGFVSEARRALAGEPLTLEWHPPLYALVVASVRSVVRDWLATGLLVSYAAALTVMVSSFVFLRRLAGRAAGWGAVLGLASSVVFIEYAASATSDVFFLALFFGAYLLVLLAVQLEHPLYWTATGLVIGLALLARSNAITLILLAAAPFLCRVPMRRQARFLLLLVLGLALPLAAWTAYASASGSALLPASNHVNLALTYYAEGPDRISGYARQDVVGRFDGVLDVLLHDPAHIARVYLKDLFRMVREGLPSLLETPLNLLFAPGLLFLAIRRWNPLLAFFLAVTLAQVLLVNMKAFEPRLYLFLVPFLGAGVAEIFVRLLAATPRGAGSTAMTALLVLGSAAAVGAAAIQAHGRIHRNDVELAEAVPKARQVMDEGATLLARKRHLAFYTDATFVYLPDVRSLAELHEAMAARPGRAELFLFFGGLERGQWPRLARLSRPAGAPDWLQPVATSERPGAWTLYRYTGSGSSAVTSSRP